MDMRGVALIVGAVAKTGMQLLNFAGGCIGHEIALTIQSQGVTGLVCADLNRDDLDRTLESISAHKSEHATNFTYRGLQVDIRDEKSVHDMIETTLSLFDRIDYFVNAAGFAAADQKPVSSMSLEEYRDMSDVHSVGSFICIKAVLQVMLKQEPSHAPSLTRSEKSSPSQLSRGTIVILTSLASEGAFIGVGNYIAAKHAVKGLIQTVAIENARRGIRINAVAPAFVSSPMTVKFLDESPKAKAAVLGDLPLGRLVEPREVADAVVFLASGSASYINGHTLTVDGGASLQLSNTPFTA